MSLQWPAEMAAELRRMANRVQAIEPPKGVPDLKLESLDISDNAERMVFKIVYRKLNDPPAET